MCIGVDSIRSFATVIGKGGESIQRMQNESGAKIQVAPGVWKDMIGHPLILVKLALCSCLSGHRTVCRWE